MKVLMISNNQRGKQTTAILIMLFTSFRKLIRTKCKNSFFRTRKPRCTNQASKVLCFHLYMNTRQANLNSWTRSRSSKPNRISQASIYTLKNLITLQYPTEFSSSWHKRLRLITKRKFKQQQDQFFTLKMASC